MRFRMPTERRVMSFKNDPVKTRQTNSNNYFKKFYKFTCHVTGNLLRKKLHRKKGSPSPLLSRKKTHAQNLRIRKLQHLQKSPEISRRQKSEIRETRDR